MAEDFSTKNLHSKVHKNYKQKFRACWVNGEFSDWLIRCPDNPDNPYCKLCCRKIEGGISHIRRHASSALHQKKCFNPHLPPQSIDGNLSPLREHTSLKIAQAKLKKSSKLADTMSESSSIEDSCQNNSTREETISNLFPETSNEESQPLQIACMSVPHLATQHNGISVERGQHQGEHATSIGLSPAMHHNSLIGSTISLPSVVTSHVDAEYDDNHLSNNSHHLQPVDVHHNLQVTSGAHSKFIGHSEIFTSNISSPPKLHNETYLMELNDVGSSCEVTVGNSHSSCQGIAGLEPDHTRHITVTIQGQDPMYIHSSVNPEPHIECAAPQQQSVTCSSAPLSNTVEESVVRMKTKKRKGKLKKLSRSLKGNERDSGCTFAGRSVKEERVDSSHYEGSKSGMDDDSKDFKRSCKWYRQKYKKNWENSKEFSEWLSPAPSDPSMAFCIACSKCLRGGITHLKRHADTPYHKKRMIETIKKRELISAKNIELRLSKFAHKFGLSDKAVCALPELLRNTFPDNNLCRLLSDERILAMLLVHEGSGHERWQGRVAIVIGASDGIGDATCHALVALGMRVVALAPSQHRMQELAKELPGERGSLTAVQCDLSKDEDVERAFAEVLRSHGAVHCCINNAGFSANTSLLDGSPSEWRSMLNVNVVGLCLLTKLCVNSMMEKGIDDGHIIYISRTSSYHIASNPSAQLYPDTSHALKALIDCLRQELRSAKSHIRVSSINPGCVSTEDVATSVEPCASEGGVCPDHVAASVVHVLSAPPCVEISVRMRSTQLTL